jgi:hypothetical protein
MAQMLLGYKNPEVARGVYATLEEARKAANWSSNKIRGFQKKLKSNWLQGWQHHRG